MPDSNESLTDTLIRALSHGQAMVKQAEDQEKIIQQQFAELTAQRKEIAALKTELRSVQTKERKWRLQNPQISSPIVLSDEIEHTPRATTPTFDARQSSPLPRIQVESSPPKKRQRTRESTPLREVHNTRAPLSRTERAIAAIPSVAEDGEDTAPKHKKSKASRLDVDGRQGAHERLGGLLTSPAPVIDALLPRPPSTSPRPINAAQSKSTPTSPKPASAALAQPSVTSPRPATAVPTLQKSSSNLSENGQTMRRRPRFMPPKPQREGNKQLRERPATDLLISDFKLNPEYVEDYDRPGYRQRTGLAAMLGEEVSDDALLREVLGKDAEEKIANMTELARVNLLHQARSNKIAEAFAKTKQQNAVDGGPMQTNFWTTDLPPSQEERRTRDEVAIKIREEVARRYADALDGTGRWLFRDELKRADDCRVP